MIALTPWATIAAAPPAFVPADPGEVLERLSVSQRRRTFTPLDTEAAIRLAEQNLALGRQSGDPRFDGRAEAALAAWDGTMAAPAEVLELRAMIAQRRHDFAGALRDLSALLAIEPGNDQAWLMRAAIFQVQGKLVASRAACMRLDERVGLLVRQACRTAAAPGTDGSPDVVQNLESALRRTPRESPGVRAWALGILAERYQMRGEEARAKTALRAGLGELPGDPYLLAALADLMLDQGGAEAAAALVPADGSSLELALRRGRALVMLGRGQAERAALAAQIDLIRARGERPHARSEAYYLLYVARNPRAALPLAIRNFGEQREFIDRRLLLEAATAAGKPQGAAAARQWMAANGFR